VVDLAVYLDLPILSLLLVIPVIGSIAVYLIGRKEETARFLATAISLIPLFLSSLLLLALFPDYLSLPRSPTRGYIAYEEAPWISELNISYILGADALSSPLVFLTALLTTLGMIFSWDEKHRVREFYSMLLLMEATIIGVFIALDFFLFFIFWEAGLVPMYFLIAIWGGPRKRYASIKFFLYTQAASLLVLLGIFVLYWFSASPGNPRTFSMISIANQNFVPGGAVQDLLFIALLVGFGTKLPMVPFHTWLPDAHVEAPTAGSVLLAGILLKMGGYGIIRVGVEMLPAGAKELYWLLAAVGIISIVYGAIVCLAQDDIKRLVAFSSVSHMGFVLLGIAAGLVAGSVLGFTGAIFQMFAHGLISAALFMIAGSIGHRVGTRNISELGGIATKMTITSGFMMTAFLASIGLPGLVGFVAEISVFLGTYEAFGLFVLLPITSVVLTAAYYIYAMQRSIFGPFREKLGEVEDMQAFEIVPLSILSASFALFGILPFLIISVTNDWVRNLFQIIGVP